MEIKILQTLFFLLIFPEILHSKNSCPISKCGYLPIINYPFKLENDHPHENCNDYIDLKCTDQKKTMINITSLGNLYVTDINYDIPSITLMSNPTDCLAEKLMTNFSLYPFHEFSGENYTFYMCPRYIMLTENFSPIDCLSNSTNVTIALTNDTSIDKTYGCFFIASSIIPLPYMTGDYNDPKMFNHLQLTWKVHACKDCENYGGENPGYTESKLPKFFSSSLFIPSVVVLITFFGVACFLRLAKLCIGERGPGETGNSSIPPYLSTDPQSVGTTHQHSSGDPNESDETFNKECTKIVVSNETRESCSVCLEDYYGKDKVRYLPKCGHYFHVECIDLWLQKSSTCPVCRASVKTYIF